MKSTLTQTSLSDASQTVLDVLARSDISADAKLRISILYALRYQRHPSAQIAQVVSSLLQQGVPEFKAGLVFVMLNFAGAEQRQDDLFSNEGFFSRGRSALQRGLKGVENVYTQHTPHLATILEALMKGKLRESSYPYAGASGFSEAYRPQDVIVFMVGGATYEEARYIHLLNQQYAGCQQFGGGPLSGPVSGSAASAPSGFAAVGANNAARTCFLLGGSTMLNSHSWLDTVQDAASRFDPGIARPPPNASGTASQASQGLNLRIGPVQLNVGRDGSRRSADPVQQLTGAGGLVDPSSIGNAAQGAVEMAGGLWCRLREGVGR